MTELTAQMIYIEYVIEYQTEVCHTLMGYSRPDHKKR